MRGSGHQLLNVMATAILLFGSISLDAAPDDVEPPKIEAQENGQMFQMDEANFDANVFQPSGNAKQARMHIETKLKLQLDELNRVCGLSDTQRKKLKLAASSDVKRFFDEVDVIRKKVKAGRIDQNAWNNIWQEIQPLRNKQSSGLFSESSFFSKAVRRTLNPEQIAKYDVVVNERRRFRYRASIEVVMTNLESSVPLRRTQHEAIVQLILDETHPPSAFGQYDTYVVMHHLSKLPESKLKPMLQEHQWQQMQAQFNQYRGMEHFLIQNGLIPKDDDEIKLLKAPDQGIMQPAENPADAAIPENQTTEQPVPCPEL